MNAKKTCAPSIPFRITDWFIEQDLRQIRWTQACISGVVEVNQLQDGQFVLFSNKSCTRFRMVGVLNEMPVMLLLPVEETHALQRELFKEISRWIDQNFLLDDTALAQDLQQAARGLRLVRSET